MLQVDVPIQSHTFDSPLGRINAQTVDVRHCVRAGSPHLGHQPAQKSSGMRQKQLPLMAHIVPKPELQERQSPPQGLSYFPVIPFSAQWHSFRVPSLNVGRQGRILDERTSGPKLHSGHSVLTLIRTHSAVSS